MRIPGIKFRSYHLTAARGEEVLLLLLTEEPIFTQFFFGLLLYFGPTSCEFCWLDYERQEKIGIKTR